MNPEIQMSEILEMLEILENPEIQMPETSQKC